MLAVDLSWMTNVYICSLRINLIESFSYESALHFIKYFLCTCWDDHVIGILHFVTVVYCIAWFPNIFMSIFVSIFILWRREWQPTSVVLRGESHVQRSLGELQPMRLQESDTTERWTHTYIYFMLSYETKVSEVKDLHCCWKANFEERKKTDIMCF